MTIVIAIIIVLVVGIGFLTVFLVKSFASPKKVSALAALIKQGKTQTAIKSAKMIIAREPRNAEAHYLLGKAYLAEKKDELALLEFKQVNQIGIVGPGIPELEFRQTIAQLFTRFKQTEEALKEYLLLIKLNPANGDYYYYAGKLFAERNRMDMALGYLRKAVEVNPRDGKAHLELGLMLYREKKQSEARAELEAALKLQSDNVQAYFYLGKMQKESKDYMSALSSFEKAQRDPQFKVKALVERGTCYMAMNAPEKAIPELERAVKAITDDGAPDALYARYFLAMCFEKIRELEKAIAQWEKIYAQKQNFRDVGEKLTQYQEFRADDKMKDYLTSGQQQFLDICKAVTSQAMNTQVRDVKSIPNGCEIIATENDPSKWMNNRKVPWLIRFYRMPELVDETKLRKMLEDVKNQNMVRGVIITSSGFSKPAVEYADNRPVELYNKERLQELLHRTNIEGPARRSK